MIDLLEKIRGFFVGGGFPAFSLSLLLCWEILLIGILLYPPAPSGLGAFAEEFRVWCFGYDPATGRTQWAYVFAMLMPQLMMGAFIALFWWEPLHRVLEQPRVLAFHLGSAALLVAGTASGLVLSDNRPASGELPFPAEALRTKYAPPEFALTNQLGELLETSTLRGKVVLLTAVYASCGHTCPAVLAQAKDVIASLTPEERTDLRVVAVTLDPQNDSTSVLAGLADHHQMRAPLYNLVTGPPHEVEGVLDRMEVARERDPKTGVINHANLFLLIDREGRLAYRLGLGPRQQRWLASALKVLLREQDRPG